jgi:MoaA/NifB/PqqE/SkfB family radical SAM enzyme
VNRSGHNHQLSPKKPIDQIELIAALHRISAAEKDRDFSRLVSLLAEDQDVVANSAMTALKRMVPMAAMVERWIDDRPVLPVSGFRIPAWIVESSRDWGGENDLFLNACIVEYCTNSSIVGRQLLLQRLARFPGARRHLTELLHKKGESLAAEMLSQHAAAVVQKQFVPQIGFSPTMICQLHCPYCISAGYSEGKEVPLATANNFLTWAVASGIQRVGLSGGEPTLYSSFGTLVSLIREKELEWYLASNGMISPGSMDTIISGRPLTVTLHLTEEVLDSSRLHAFKDTIRQLQAGKVYTILRINIGRPDMEIDRYLDVAAAGGIREIRAAVPMPNAYRHNAFVDASQLEGYGRALDRYIQEGRKRKLQTFLAKPFPLCYLTEETGRTFLGNDSMANNCSVHMLEGTNNIVVTPDMKCIPCLGLNRPSSREIVRYRNVDEIGDIFRRDVHRLMHIPLLEECRSCPFSLGGRCIGGCLSYRLNGETG